MHFKFKRNTVVLPGRLSMNSLFKIPKFEYYQLGANPEGYAIQYIALGMDFNKTLNKSQTITI